MRPTISVNIVTYNSEKEIMDCIKSVKNQNYNVDFINIIDNSTNHSTINALSKLNGIHLVKNNDNLGFSEGHNIGLNLNKSDYVLVLNPDVILHENYIENIILYMEKNRNIGLATGKLYRDYNNRILDSTGIVMKKNRRAIDRGTNEIDIGQYDQMNEIFGVSGAAAVYRRAMIEDISYNDEFFDNTFFAYKEDVDVSWRANLLGWKAVFVPNAIATHERGWNEKKKREDIPMFIRQRSYINRYFYIFKNDSFSNIVLHSPFVFFFECASSVYTLLKERQLLQAWGFFKEQLPVMRLKRRHILQKKKVSNKEIRSFFKGIW